jgi:hypothetical protein
MTLLSGPALAAPQGDDRGRHHSPTHGQVQKDKQTRKGGGKQGRHEPAGNNGTVKIAPLGDLDTIPNNSPHQGCTFTVQWYGFDEGDYYSDVDFALQAPTATGRTLSGGEPARVFVGEDAAGGAGQDMDAEQVYTLDFTGAPHPKQGYHVKLTVHTPFSQGSDKKSKVFWVEGCDDTSTTPSVTPTTTPTVAPTESTTTPGTGVDNPGGDNPGGSTTPTAAPTESVAPDGGTTPGTQATPAGQETVAPVQAVPTAVDAGEEGSVGSPLTDTSKWLLALVGGLVAAAGAALGLRGRRGSHQI